MPGLQLIAFTATALVAGLLVTGIASARRAREVRRTIRAIDIQGHFANCRRALFRLVVERKISAESATFERLYTLCSHIQRNPDRYDEISRSIKQALLRKGEKDRSLEREAKKWSEETAHVAVCIATGLNGLVLNSSPMLRFFVMLEDHLGAVSWVDSLLGRLADWQRRRIEAKGELKDIERGIHRLELMTPAPAVAA